MQNGTHSPDLTELKAMVLDLCAEMHCGSHHEVESRRRTLYHRFGHAGWLRHGAILAALSEQHAPEMARDITGAVLPERVLILEEGHMRAAMRATGLPPEVLEVFMEHNQHAILHVTNTLAYAHFGEEAAAIQELEKAHARDPEVLVAAVSLLLRIAADCTPCPRHEQ